MIISLIGMMGCGKSTIAKLLAEKLSIKLIDTDELIIIKEKTSINEIFKLKGEDYFRKVESDVLREVLSVENSVISTGGGIVKLEENISLLKENSKVFYLKANEDVLFERVKNNTDRPLLNTDDMYNKVKTLLSERKDKYEMAHYIVDATKEPNKIVEEIIENLK